MGDFRRTFSVPRLWIILSIGTAVRFSALLALGWEIYQKAPPIPEAVRSQSGQVIYTRENIQTGQQVWQSEACPPIVLRITTDRRGEP